MYFINIKPVFLDPERHYYKSPITKSFVHPGREYESTWPVTLLGLF